LLNFRSAQTSKNSNPNYWYAKNIGVFTNNQPNPIIGGFANDANGAYLSFKNMYVANNSAQYMLPSVPSNYTVLENSGNAILNSTAQKLQSSYVNWDFDNVFDMGSSTPVLKAHPYY
jgi:hypothetical protein